MLVVRGQYKMSADLRGAQLFRHVQTDFTLALSAHPGDRNPALCCANVVLQAILHHIHDLGDDVGTTGKVRIRRSSDGPMHVSARTG